MEKTRPIGRDKKAAPITRPVRVHNDRDATVTISIWFRDVTNGLAVDATYKSRSSGRVV